MKITKKNLLVKFYFGVVAMFIVLNVLLPSFVSADTLWEKQIGMDTRDGVGGSFGETVDSRNDVRDVRLVLANIIRVFLGFMGIIFLVLIIYGGFLWMTAAGQDDKVNKAKSLLIAGVIGLIIVVSSFAIAELVTDKIFEATVTAS